MKTKVKGIIFDFGGVISKPPTPSIIKRMCLISGINFTDLRESYIRFRYDYDQGKISAVEYWRIILDADHVIPDEQRIKKLIDADIKGWTCINKKMLSFIHEIRPKVSRLGILSNMNWDCLDFVEKNFQWLHIFDVLIFSCKIGFNKPEMPIYEYCLDSIGLGPDDCLFIDDSEENIAAAAQRSMHTLHFKSFSLFTKELFEKYSMEL